MYHSTPYLIKSHLSAKLHLPSSIELELELVSGTFSIPCLLQWLVLSRKKKDVMEDECEQYI